MSLGQEIHLYTWIKLVTDILHFEGASHLLIVDYTSRLLVVHNLSSMTGQHVATQCKHIISGYGWPETLISYNGPCYAAEAFTNMMKEYGVNHIPSFPHYPQSNGLCEKFVQIVKNLFHKAKEEGKDIFKCLMIYCNTPLSSSSHDLHLGQDVMFQDSTRKRWFSATITSMCSEPRSYKITAKKGVTYRKTQAHLKPYSPQNKKSEDEHCLLQSSNMQTIKSNSQKLNTVDDHVQSYSRPKRDIKPPVKLNL